MSDAVPEADHSPSVRARAVHDALAFLDVYRPGLKAQVRSRIPRRSLETIETADRDQYISIDHDRHVPAAIVAVLGPTEALRYFQFLLTRHLENRLFKGVLGTAVHLFGMTPKGLLKALPTMWKMVYRDVCNPRTAIVAADHAEVRFERVTPEVLATEAYALSFEGFLSGIFRLCEVDGTVRTNTSIRDRTIVCQLRWTPR